MRIHAALAVLMLVIGVLFGRLFFTPDPPPPRYQRVIVPESVLVIGKPDTIVKWRERIVWRTAQPEQVATATDAALPEVSAFCGAAGWVIQPAPGGDTVPPPLPPARLLLTAGTYDGRELRQWGVLSNGDAWSAEYRVRAPLQWTVTGDSLLVQGHRMSGLRVWAERAAWVAGGLVVGQLVSF